MYMMYNYDAVPDSLYCSALTWGTTIMHISLHVFSIIMMTHSVVIARVLIRHKHDGTRGVQRAGPFSNSLEVGA